ncbi:hypothetical protein V6N13_052777 [Hibiscus sabdariffa]|uniref:Uncharacterized protein n=2 Tax=Hibiscus sabdariffa TaxID=183260 RepID=A0ABR2Q5A3_9ROSI
MAAAAAQQLMQLSDEDNKNSSSNDDIINNNNNNVKAKINGKRCSEQSQDEITCAMMEEIFGKEEEVSTSRPIKKRRFRFLDSIYKETKAFEGRLSRHCRMGMAWSMSELRHFEEKHVKYIQWRQHSILPR